MMLVGHHASARLKPQFYSPPRAPCIPRKEKKENSRAPWFGRQTRNYYTTQVPRAFPPHHHSEGSCRPGGRGGAHDAMMPCPPACAGEMRCTGGRTLPNPTPPMGSLLPVGMPGRAAIPPLALFFAAVNPFLLTPLPARPLGFADIVFFGNFRNLLGLGCTGGEKGAGGGGGGG